MLPRLRRRDQFESILRDYHPSQEALGLLQDTAVALLDGISGSGCNTLIEGLLTKGGYHRIVSDTTRSPRQNNGRWEQDGVEYWFKSEEDFLAGLEQGEYIEAAIIHKQQVSGISVREVERAAGQGKIAINDVQPDGIEAFLRHKPDTICIFVTPPDLATWLSRLKRRGDMDQPELLRRIESAEKEFIHAMQMDQYHILVNDNFQVALDTAHRICVGGQTDNAEAKEVMYSLHQQIVEYKKTLVSS